jgi:N utilization substance protein A
LAPAEISRVFLDDTNKEMEIVVPDTQLSLAIGKRGQNVRLAAQLTGWKLDIKSEKKLEEELSGTKAFIATIPGLGIMQAEILVNEGIKTAAEIAELSPRNLVRLLNMDEAESEKVIKAAAEMAAQQPTIRHSAKIGTPEGDREELFASSSATPEEQRGPSVADTARNDRIAVFAKLSGVGEATAHALADAGYGTIGDIVADSAEEVAQKTGLSLGIARTVQMAADRHLQSELKG